MTTTTDTPAPDRPATGPGRLDEDADGPRDETSRRYARRLRYGRPGPKTFDQTLESGFGPRPRRLLEVPDLDDLDIPDRLPGDPPWQPARTHPFEFTALFYRRDGTPIPTEPRAAWADAVREVERNRRIALTHVHHRGARIDVSTMFMMVDVGVGRGGPPVLWETMLFHGGHPSLEAGTWRYSSVNAAVRGHARIVAALRTALAARRPTPRRRYRWADGPRP